MNVQIDKTRVSAALRRVLKEHYQHEVAQKLQATQAEISLLLNKKKEALRHERLERVAKVCDVSPYTLLAPPLRKIVDRYSAPF